MLVLISLCSRVSGAAQGCAGNSAVHILHLSYHDMLC